ncbi:aldose epimerase family protein [Fusobacterium sp. MFO224]|uniref:aldose epimerase family protein n=1 Tax=Fusobacterium sp. MFO224 TaxID=3378070 RepID=UPI003851A70C
MGGIERKFFGKLKTGEEVFSYILKNKEIEVEVLDYGGIIRRILTRDKKGKFENIVLNFKTLGEYEDNSNYYLGGIVGRNAGRIKSGNLKINDEIYQLKLNNNGNNLHAYPECFITKLWKASTIIQEDQLKLVLTRTSPHLESNFPGSVDFRVVYTVKGNKLTIEYIGIPDRETYMNLTNHTYFNLSGDVKEDIGNQKIKLFCDKYIQVDEFTLPKNISKVESEIFDLREGIKFEEILKSKDEQIKIVNNGLDHPFIFSKQEKIDGKITDEKSGRVMEVKTNQPVVVVYTGNYLNEIFEKNHLGFCLEMQDYPDVLQFLARKAKLYSEKNNYYNRSEYTFYNF